jgi:RNA polymerase sigma-70 factor (ECF subfamily)
MTRVDERELIQRIVAKDDAAFRTLVELYQSSVLNACYGILSDRQDAEDVAQDVFVMVYRKAGSFRGESGLSTWLYRIAVNLSLNRLRKRKWDRLFGVLTLSEAELGDTTDTMEAPEQERPDRQLETSERSRILNDVLSTLPGKQRVAIILHKIEGLSHQEIAEILQISLSSVESLIHRAKRNLQKKLIPLLGKI